MADLFEFFKKPDAANCAFCERWLTWEEMRPSGYGPAYRENVCSMCRDEEIALGGT